MLDADTLYVSAVVAVAGRDPVKVTKSLGDHGKGNFDPVILLRDVAVGENESALFTYTIVNAGNINKDDIEKAITGASTVIANAGANVAGQAVGAAAGAAAGAAIGAVIDPAVPILGTIIGSSLGSLTSTLLQQVWGIIMADCDGPVAAAANFLGGSQLREACSQGGFISHSEDNPGIDSPHGCGETSHYHIHWSVHAAQPSTAVVSWGPGRLDVFALGPDCYHKSWNGNIWGPSMTTWESLGGLFNSPLSAVSWGLGRLDIFGLGTDNRCYYKVWDGTRWFPSETGWESLGGLFNSPLSAVSWGQNRLDIFALGPNNQCYHKSRDGNTWGPSMTEWEPLGGLFKGPLSAVSWGSGRLDIFGLVPDNHCYHKSWDGNTWGPSMTEWESLGDNLGA